MPIGRAGSLQDVRGPLLPRRYRKRGHACPVPSRPAQALEDLVSTLPRTPTAWASLVAPRVGLGEPFWVWRKGCGERAMGDNDRAGAPPLASVHRHHPPLSAASPRCGLPQVMERPSGRGEGEEETKTGAWLGRGAIMTPRAWEAPSRRWPHRGGQEGTPPQAASEKSRLSSSGHTLRWSWRALKVHGTGVI